MDKNYYNDYFHLERNHWWFRARLEILEAILKNHLIHNTDKPLRILNAGVATGATTTMLEKYGTVTSLEYDHDCCEFLRNHLQMEVTEASLTDLPFEDQSFDLVCAFDVIEHIEDDGSALREIRRVLKYDGSYFLTVPAFSFLWSEHDEINHHFRRYTRKMLTERIVAAGLSSDYASYFNFWLFPPIAAVRMLQRLTGKKDKTEKPESDFKRMKGLGFMDGILYRIFKSEMGLLLKNGVPLPWGISVVAHGGKSLNPHVNPYGKIKVDNAPPV